jgi:ribulose 1,5-bisphosphate carboxylase large subunit-like protein
MICSLTKNYATIDYVLARLKSAGINPLHVDDVVRFFGTNCDEWATYLKYINSVGYK